MKKIIFLMLAIFIIAGITGCSTEEKEVLNVYNWGDYIDIELLNEFEEEFGIQVNYETYPTNEDLYVKLKQGGTNYDLVFPSDYMVDRLAKENLIQEIDLAKIPNFKYIDDSFKNLDFDKDNKYSVPYTWGTVGILYNTLVVEEQVDSWDILWNEKYEDNILMYDSQRDTIAVALKKLGYSMNETDIDKLNEAKDELIKQKEIILAYVGDNVRDMMINEEAVLAVVWSGEAVAAMEENMHLAYSIPKEGSNIWFDNMVIPADAQNFEAAHKFIDFILRPEISARIIDYVGYSMPNTETLKLIDSSYLETNAFNPSKEDIDNCEPFIYIGDAIEDYNNVWTELKIQ